MYELVMVREYLGKIVEGKKTSDARSYETNNRGTIALADAKKSAIIGFIDLIGTHKITAEGMQLVSGKTWF